MENEKIYELIEKMYIDLKGDIKGHLSIIR